MPSGVGAVGRVPAILHPEERKASVVETTGRGHSAKAVARGRAGFSSVQAEIARGKLKHRRGR